MREQSFLSPFIYGLFGCIQVAVRDGLRASTFRQKLYSMNLDDNTSELGKEVLVRLTVF